MKPNSIKQKKIISQSPLLFFIFVLAYCPIMGQSGPNEKLVQPKNYEMWHTMRVPQISGDGNWNSYRLDYKQGQDTLVVLDKQGKISFKFPAAYNGQFETSKKPNIFAFNDENKGVGILHLKTGKTEWVKEADRFEFSRDGKYLAFFSPREHNGYLKLLDIIKNETTIIHDIEHFSFDPHGHSAVVTVSDSSKTNLELLNLDTMKRSVILSSNNSKILFPTWNAKGNALAFIEITNTSQQQVYYFENRESPILKKIDQGELRPLGKMEISKNNLSISGDGERIFFWTHSYSENLKMKDYDDSVKVQVWKGSDKLIYPQRKLESEFNLNDKLAVWWPKTGKVFQIGNEERPEVILTGNQKFALSYNNLTYEPQFGASAPVDYYITNLETAETSLFAKKLEYNFSSNSMSPNGEYIAYFKENNWWIFNIKNNQHIKVSNDIPYPLKYKHAPHTLKTSPYGIMGWTTKNQLLVYDEFDIWIIDADGSSSQCLTNGRSNKIVFRYYKGLYDGFYQLGNSAKSNGFDFSDDNVFIMRDSVFNYGYAIRKPDGKIDHFFSETGKISELRKAKFSNSYIYLKEKNTSPPAMYILERRKSKMLVQSNRQYLKFPTGKTELISYKNKEGESLHGLLHYPDNFEEGQEYPMIVNIYELKSNLYQVYENPDYYNGEGFNYRNFTAAGYFVLEPDVIIQEGNPGISATDCVVTSVNKVFEKGVVNKKSVGIIGHSFGGYETAFIITQTNLFSAAVVGGGVFDIISGYHSLSENSGTEEYGVYENQQWQMGKSFYEDRNAYKKNSPLEYAQNIETPTLIWTGNQDYHVNWHQSVAMFLALRRLEFEVQLLIYENEAHTLLQANNQKDLTFRIQDWFDKYLKT